MPSKPPSSLPKHWPADILYLSNTTCHYSPRLFPAQLLALQVQVQVHSPISNLASFPQPPSSKPPLGLTVSPVLTSPSPLVRISPISDPAHPANGQHGVFASRNLAPDSFIVLYLGYVHGPGPHDTDPSSDYDLSLDRELGVGVDARSMGNESRFVNDYRGVRNAGPNAEFRDCVVQVGTGKGKGRWERRIGVFVLGAGRGGSGRRGRGIRKGEEVLLPFVTNWDQSGLAVPALSLHYDKANKIT